MEGTTGIEELQGLAARLVGSTVERVHVPPDGEGGFGLRLRLTRRRTDGTTQTRLRRLAVRGVWRLETAEHVLVGNEDRGLEEALARLEGRPLTDVEFRPPGLETRFDFDGLRLQTFPMYRRDPEHGEYDHWLLWLPDGRVLVAGSELTVELSQAWGTAAGVPAGRRRSPCTGRRSGPRRSG